jgi:5-methyltetrahydrofolate corrinoid/iron sulfur protein methyltransferase
VGQPEAYQEGNVLVISDNITTRNRKVARALKPIAESVLGQPTEAIKRESAHILKELARDCLAAGADMLSINLQQRYDRPHVMEFAVAAVQEAVNCRLCLSSNRIDTLEKGLRSCQQPPIVNYISLNRERLGDVLPLAAKSRAGVILLVNNPVTTVSAEDTVKLAAVMVGAANESGIPNDRIMIDPGVLHITSEIGQRYTSTLTELLPALAETFDPPVMTTVWINNVSAGAARRLRPVINSTFLAMLAGLGLSSAFVDVLDWQTMRTMRLIKVFRNQRIYADGDMELSR